MSESLPFVYQVETMGKTRRGGTKIGKGSTGYIVSPPIPCEGDGGQTRKGFVTKVIDPDFSKTTRPEHWKIPTEVLAKLKELDPEQKYFYYPVDCVPGTLSKENVEDGITDDIKPFTQLLPYAPGGTWSDPVYRPRSWKEWVKGRNEQVLESTAHRTDAQKEHLIRAVTLLHQNNIIHGDLHQGNVVIAKDGLPRLIDLDSARLLKPKQHVSNVEIERENELLQDLVNEKFMGTSKPKGARRRTRRRKLRRDWHKA